jgi:SAM-dependent methyltransferase
MSIGVPAGLTMVSARSSAAWHPAENDMADWSDGYITNIEYTSGFYSGLSPLAQNFALLYRGYAGPQLADGFTYCELGCGRGFSTALLAAANPAGAFWGIDFNPSHISDAEQLKQATSVPNVSFLELSFAESLTAELPKFDFISLHGVWSWISPDNRRAILDFIYAKLKPGGVVYISYNALPGWSAAAPLRQLLVERLRGQSGATPDSIEAALSFAGRVRDAGAGYFRANPASGKRLDSFASMPKNYLAHEYFNAHWSASYHSEVVAELAAAKLTFAAPSVLSEQMDAFLLAPPARELLKEVTDPVARETIRDYFLNAQFRRDLFVRGARQLSEAERNERLLQTRLVLTRPAPQFPFKVSVPVGEVTIDANPAKAVFDTLTEGPRTLGEILKDPAIAGGDSGNTAFKAITVLLAGGAILPALGPEREELGRERAASFNQTMLARFGSERQEHTLASPVLGTGMAVPPTEQMFLVHAAGDKAPPIDKLIQEMAARNRSFMKDGKPASEDETKAELKAALGAFRQERLPIYRRLGMC